MPAVNLAHLFRFYGLPEPVPEYRFHPVRKWRFDWAWVEQKTAVEVMGGTWAGGRHTRGAGYRRDCEKLNAGQLLGWLVLYCTTDMVKSGEVFSLVKEALETRMAESSTPRLKPGA